MSINAVSEPKICYLILAHADPAHLEKLVSTLDYKSRIFIHLDAKSEMSDFADIKLPKSAKFISKRVKVYWGGISMIKICSYIKEIPP